MARRVGFWIAWYVLLLLLWLAFVDTFNPAEMALGLVAAAIAATAAEVVRSQELVRFRMDPRWLRDLPQLPLRAGSCPTPAPAGRSGGCSGWCPSQARPTTPARPAGGRW